MIPDVVLARWSRFAEGAAVRPFGTGLINKTFLVEKGADKAVFQRLHPVFAGIVNADIDAVTAHLARKGLVTPRVIKADDGSLFVDDPTEGRPWRALTLVKGASVDKVDSPARARAGGALVARFHAAVADLAYEYQHVRIGVHDTEKHMATLRAAVAQHRAHRLFAEAEPMAQEILRARVGDFSRLPERNAHGDLKISNLLFDDAGAGVCLVDLDTLGKMVWPHEMGDALRSWTNPLGEDVVDAAVDKDIFEATVRGYAEGGGAAPLTSDEKQALVDGMFTICTELSARFLADALNESYFGWNPERYATRGEHNLVRARGQWSLAQSVWRERTALKQIVAGALG